MTFPTAAQRGQARPLLVYDGDCAFCTRCVEAIRARIRPAVDFRPWQELDLPGLGLTEQQVGRAVQWIGAESSRASGAAAFARVLSRADRQWQLLGTVMRVPPVSWLAAAGYRLIADNRHRMPGGTSACALPPAERR
ncbi:thiol-disulfide oxidoreductase DCC family protein, partial [Candidatus Frankia alpina]